MIRRAAVYMGNRRSDAHDRDGRSVFLWLISEKTVGFSPHSVGGKICFSKCCSMRTFGGNPKLYG